jgi:hypothetical protein
LTVRELRDIIRGGITVLDEKVDKLRDENEDVGYQMFKSTLRTFLCDEGVCEDTIGDEERFREEFECYIIWNIEKLFDFPVLLMEEKTYEIEFNGINNEINDAVLEQKEFKDKVLKFITEEQFNEILINSWDGSGFFGIIISGSDIIKAMKGGNNIVGSSEVVVGIHDGFNGSGYFKRVNISHIRDSVDKICRDREYGIAIDKARLDWGKYGLGAVYGNVEWRYE